MNANRPLLYMYTFFSFYFLGIISSYGQGWPDFSEKTTFIEAQRHFTDYWSDRTPTRGSGWKQYKRWEWYWSTRTMPDGSFPPANYNMIQYDSFVAKNDPDIIKSTNLNSNWNSLGPSSSNSGYSGIGRVNCIAFHPSSSSTIWAGTPAGGIWRTTNGGSNWTPLSDNLSVLGVTAIAVNPSNPNILYIGTGDGFGYDTQSIGVLKSTDGGVSWAPTGLTFDVGSNNQVFQLIVNPSNPTILMAATTNGLYRTTNSGSSWTQVYTSMTRDVRFKPNAANTVYACTNDKLLRSTNGGQSFSVVATIPNSIRIALAVSPANSGLVVAVSCNNEGAFNGLYRSTNSGATYALTSSTPNILNASSNGSGTDGQGWYDLCVSISPTNANMVFVGGVNLWRSTNGGSSWALINFWNSSGGAPSGVATVHADKHFLGWQNNNTIFQGCDGGIYKSTNNGTSWTDISNTMVISQIYRISSSQADSKILCGLQDNGTKLRNGSNNWIDVLGGDGMDCEVLPKNWTVQ